MIEELRGKFITFEGIDGTGKTSQLNLLVDRIKKAGLDTVTVKEPGDKINGKYIGSEIGAQIRAMLFFDPTTKVMDPDVVDLLFLADHIQLWRKTILPALENKKTVVCDRYADSQFSYGVAKGSSSWIMKAYQDNYGPVPDITILLVGDPVFLYPRTKRSGTSEEGKQDGKNWAGVESQRLVKDAYILQLSNLPRTITIYVDETKDIQAVHQEIWKGIERILGLNQTEEKQLELFPDGVR